MFVQKQAPPTNPLIEMELQKILSCEVKSNLLMLGPKTTQALLFHQSTTK